MRKVFFMKIKNITKKILCGVLASVMACSFPAAAAASEESSGYYDGYYEEAPIVTATPTPDPHTEYYNQAPDTDSIKEWPAGPKIEGESAILMDMSTGTVLYAKNADKAQYPASITKIMTALLAFQYGNMDDVVTITQENVTLEEGSQVIGFVPGDQVTMDQLVHGLLVYSGNDAASAIATHIGGSTEEFVSMMNSYAAKLGCTGTHFTNPHGLQDENHYTTPYDIYLMLKEALKYPEFTEITQMSSYTLAYKNSEGADMSVSLMATDQYLTGESTAPKGITILGGKTGTTSDAGNCLALLCQDAYGEPYISIVMGASSKELLYKQMSSILQNVNTEENI